MLPCISKSSKRKLSKSPAGRQPSKSPVKPNKRPKFKTPTEVTKLLSGIGQKSPSTSK